MELELMSPCGSFESLTAAIKAGAGSVYFGVGELNMRSRSAKFSVKDLKKVARICNEHGIKSYLALNTVMYNKDLDEVKKTCDAAKKAGITAVIASDIAVIKYARSIGLEIHMSTQVNISNIEAVKYYSQFADVVVLARELSLEQIKEICCQIKEQNIRGPNKKLVKVEVFIHGAMCVSVSGKCYMSLAVFNQSANRGACFQNCRRKYKVIDDETGDELVIDNNYIMSPKDLCTIGMIDKLVDAGVSVFKIEGRARSPEYVYTVTKVYKQAIDAVMNNSYTKDKIESWRTELKTVFNRGFWKDGYYLGKHLGEWSGVSGSKATTEKIFIGKVINFYRKSNIAQILMQAYELKLNDKIMIVGPTTGVVKTKVESIYNYDDESIQKANKEDKVTILVPERVRENDEVYLVREKS